MAESGILKRTQEMLNEEKWTRAAISAYTVNQIKELDNIYHEAAKEKLVDEIYQICSEHLAHSKNSIIALYLTGIINLTRQTLDDSPIVELLNIFTENHKWNIVEYICLRVLDYVENRNALIRLAECYENENKNEEKFAIWERLIRIDTEETELVKTIAEYYEQKNDLETAIDYYRKALHRFIAKGQFAMIKEMWEKLITLTPSDVYFFLYVQKKIAKNISGEKAAQLLEDLYKVYKTKKDWDTSILILKQILEYEDRNPVMRKEIVECYRAKYANHSRLEECLRISNISQTYRAIFEAISDFEKHIQFDVGNFVYHRNWSIGRIRSIEGENIYIDFAKKRNHEMTLKMAFDNLKVLPKDHIWVLKAIMKQEVLKEKIKSDISWALKILIKSFDNNTDLKTIKKELVPAILTESEWTSWSKKAKDILQTDPTIGNTSDSVNTYMVRDRPLTFEEKTYNQFKAEKNFFSRLQCIRNFIDKGGDTDSELFTEMIEFVATFIKTGQTSDEYSIAAYLFIKELAQHHTMLKKYLTVSFTELVTKDTDFTALYNFIKDTNLRQMLLQTIKQTLANWVSIYMELLPTTQLKSMIDILLDAGETEQLLRFFNNVIENYRDYRSTFIWMIRSLWTEKWIEPLYRYYDKVLIILIHILDICYKEIENHKNTVENKKLIKAIDNFLFRDGAITKFIEQSSKEAVERMYALISDVRTIDPAIKLNIRKKIQERFPDFKFQEEERSIVSRGLIVTEKKYNEKTQQLNKLVNEDVPANQKEIAFALSLGDLRENAEYKAAKEKQDELNSKIAKLKNEIERAQIFDRASASTTKISFGTKVTLLNLNTNKNEVFTLLGPWESDPANNIISYLSPLGKKLVNHKVDDMLSFSINEKQFNYKVIKIELADI